MAAAGILIASAVVLVVVSGIVLAIAGWCARGPGRTAGILSDHTRVMRWVAVISALAIGAATVAMFFL